MHITKIRNDALHDITLTEQIFSCFIGTGVSEVNIPSYEIITSPINRLTPNGHYMGRTAQLTSRFSILYIYSTNIRTEYFKQAA